MSSRTYNIIERRNEHSVLSELERCAESRSQRRLEAAASKKARVARPRIARGVVAGSSLGNTCLVSARLYAVLTPAGAFATSGGRPLIFGEYSDALSWMSAGYISNRRTGGRVIEINSMLALIVADIRDAKEAV